MAITSRERMYEVLVRWQEDGSVSAHQARITELLDDDGAVISAQIALPVALDAADVGSVVGETVPALTAQVADLQTQLTQAQADKQAALDAQASAEAALGSMTDARDALQAQLDAIQNPPIDHVISQRFKLALDQLGLLDTVDEFISGQSREVQLRWDFPEFYRNDTMLNQLAGVLVAFLPDPPTNDANALLDQVFALAKTIT